MGNFIRLATDTSQPVSPVLAMQESSDSVSRQSIMSLYSVDSASMPVSPRKKGVIWFPLRSPCQQLIPTLYFLQQTTQRICATTPEYTIISKIWLFAVGPTYMELWEPYWFRRCGLMDVDGRQGDLLLSRCGKHNEDLMWWYRRYFHFLPATIPL